MAVKYCHFCNQDIFGGHKPTADDLAAGEVCPVCHQPACRRHLTTVRWRWRESGDLGAVLICRECQRSYAHRSWDSHNRDWIT